MESLKRIMTRLDLHIKPPAVWTIRELGASQASLEMNLMRKQHIIEC